MEENVSTNRCLGLKKLNSTSATAYVKHVYFASDLYPLDYYPLSARVILLSIRSIPLSLAR